MCVDALVVQKRVSGSSDLELQASLCPELFSVWLFCLHVYSTSYVMCGEYLSRPEADLRFFPPRTRITDSC